MPNTHSIDMGQAKLRYGGATMATLLVSTSLDRTARFQRSPQKGTSMYLLFPPPETAEQDRTWPRVERIGGGRHRELARRDCYGERETENKRFWPPQCER